MNIFEFAMRMERDGKAFYEEKAARTTDAELKKMFTMLAEEEERHFKFFKRLRDGEIDQAVQEIPRNSKTLSQAKNIFQELSQRKESTPFGEDLVSAWTEAMWIEEKAERFYREKAEQETDETQKKLLHLIADEERTHIHMIDGILTYLKYPESFAGSAQFKNFMSLEGN